MKFLLAFYGESPSCTVDVISLIFVYKNSSGDEIANVLVNDDIAHTQAYFKIPKKRQTYFV